MTALTSSDLETLLRRAERYSPCADWEAYSAFCCPDMGGIAAGAAETVCPADVGRRHPMALEQAELVAYLAVHAHEILAILREAGR